MTLNDIQLMIDFNYWATNRIMQSLSQLTPEQFTKDVGVSHVSLRGTLVHVMGAEAIWVKRIKGEGIGEMPRQEEFSTVDALGDHWQMVEHLMVGLSHMWKSDDDILKIISYRDLKGNPYSHPVWQIVQHLVNHSSYHRGQSAAILRQLGVKPIGTDLITFYRERPSA